MSYKIDLFTTSDCQNCKIVKMILEQYGIVYTEKNINLNKEFEDEFISVTNGHKYVPTLVIDGKIYINVKPHEILELIKIINQKNAN